MSYNAFITDRLMSQLESKHKFLINCSQSRKSPTPPVKQLIVIFTLCIFEKIKQR